MSIRTKVVSCFVAILLIFGGASVFNYLRSRHANSRLALVNELLLPVSRNIVHLQSSTQGLAEDIRRYYFQTENTPSNSTFARMVRDLYPYLIQRRFQEALALLEEHRNSELGPAVIEVHGLLAKARTTFQRLATTRNREEFQGAYVQLRAQLKRVLERVDQESQKITGLAQNEGRENLIFNLILSVAVAITGVLAVGISHRVLSPLPQLIESIRKIADGDLEQSLKVKPSDKDEIALLAREYNRMLETINQRTKKIEEQQKELVQAERLAAIGQLSAEIVHEIRNPLNSMSLNVDWLEDELKGSDEEVSRTLRSISREIERLHMITESYLVRARVPVQEEQKIGVNELIGEILDFSREEYLRRKIHIEMDLSPQEIYVNTDRSKLKQAFLNVFRNAREAMPNGGTLRIRSEIRNNVFRIEVSDTGYGMNEATRTRTFRPFFTTKPHGTGLGLMLTKSIVEEAHGTVQCDSELGRGTTFTFQFPA